MQMCWKNNKRVLDMINYQRFPVFPNDLVTYEKMDQQFTDYYLKDADKL